MSMWSLPAYGPMRIVDDAEVDVASGATSNFGSWTEVIAATAEDADHINFSTHNRNAANTDPYLIGQLAIGPAGSEVVVVPFFQLNNISRTDDETFVNAVVPFHVPAGTRVSARIKKLGDNSFTLQVAVKTLKGRSESLSHISNRGIAYGCGPSETGDDQVGKAITTGSPGFSAWVELAAAAEADHRMGLIHVVRDSTTEPAISGDIQIGIGPAGSEEIVCFSHMSKADTSFAIPLPGATLVHTQIKEGDRIAARAGNSAGATDIRVGFVGY